MSTRDITPRELCDAAKLLMPDPTDDMPTEYARGVCELIGRVLLDCCGIGECTSENAELVAAVLGVRIHE